MCFGRTRTSMSTFANHQSLKLRVTFHSEICKGHVPQRMSSLISTARNFSATRSSKNSSWGSAKNAWKNKRKCLKEKREVIMLHQQGSKNPIHQTTAKFIQVYSVLIKTGLHPRFPFKGPEFCTWFDLMSNPKPSKTVIPWTWPHSFFWYHLHLSNILNLSRACMKRSSFSVCSLCCFWGFCVY